MRIVLILVGMVLGLVLGDEHSRLFDSLAGAILGFALADLWIIRSQLETLRKELAAFRTNAARSRPATEEATFAEPPASAAPTATSAPPASAAPTVPPRVFAPVAPAAPESAPAPSAPAPPAATRPSVPSSRAAAHQAPAPNFIFAAIRQFFTGGNTVVRVGIVVLLFGVAFLLSYMAQHTYISIELRLSGVAVGAVALLLFGWHLRKSKSGFALALQGGAIGILYLTVFGALRLYMLLPVPLAFALLVGIAALSAALAVLQNSQAFALLAVTGGFLAPVLASTGHGSHVVLFSYYAVLNAGILGVAWFKAWRPLNIAGFVYTFAIGTGWGVLQYHAADFATTEPFLVFFFLLYVAISVLFTIRQPADLRGYVDATLVFGTPLIVFGLQSAMLHDRLMALAYSALALSAFYLSAAWLLTLRRNPSQRVLTEAFLALGVAFFTVAIPLALNVHWNVVTWGVEGAALIWVGCRQSRMLPRVSGTLLSLAAGCLIASEFKEIGDQLTLPLDNYYGVLTLTLACLFAARTLYQYRERLSGNEAVLASLLFWWGLGWWVLGGLTEIAHYVPHGTIAASLALLAATALGASELHRGIPLGAVRGAALLLLPVMVITALYLVPSLHHPFAAYGYLAWPFAFLAWYWIMFRHEGPARGAAANILNTAAAWFLCLMVSWELAWNVADWVSDSDTWPAIAWTAMPALALYLMPRLASRLAWPVARHRQLYLFVVGPGIAVYLGIWSLIADFFLNGAANPLPYWPLLNPLDIAQALVLVVLIRYWLFLRPVRGGAYPRMNQQFPLPALIALSFIWLNAVLLRTLHHRYGVPLNFDALVASTLVQTSLSIFWTVIALVTMLTAARKQSRATWLLGASLMGVVILKLFFVDLSRIGSIERIVSFVGVGLLMLVVGYFSPLPPPLKEAA